ncbi:Ca2+-transporting ATPase [Clostridium amylolyticum]|uniref:P-type Ca(2+) transporter n=1 Tax=Clostridium amylolyticum TaxID=1121298 RepID=A0A1M6ET62_9CLOT|nr:cation-translocating P-type ATPase [Clostridium amylolyticum]SHI88586.1 Ca2+-transporting ATPase [Clostridium amylolyticum]
MYYNQETEKVLKDFDVDPVRGLSSEEVSARLEKYGENQLTTQKKKTLLQLFFAQLNDPLIYILIVAALISGFTGEINEAVIITIVIVLNAVIGVAQESKAEKAMEALQKMSTPKAYVRRNGEIVEVNSKNIVPGDIIVLDAGRFIPCDLRLINSANLKVEESALTGESVPVDKDSTLVLNETDIALGDQKNMAFMSTLVTYGRGEGVAIGTGMETQIGKIAKMLEQNVDEQTPLQKKLGEIGKLLGIAALVICVLMFGIAVIQKRDLFEMFLTAISLAVAAIPEGLPAIVAIVLAIGVQKMVKHNAIVRKLPAVETLGSVNVVCSDKTGTLTQNKMTVTKFYANNSVKNSNEVNIEDPVERLLLENMILCNDATSNKESKTGDPTEIALLDLALNYGITKEGLNKEHIRNNELPFDSDRKLMSTINQYGDKHLIMTKGAIDNIIQISNNIYINGEIKPLTEDMKMNIMNASNAMSEDALRVLGFAYREVSTHEIEPEDIEKDLIVIGLVGMIDPPREEVKDSIETCKKAGITTIMITGDHKKTALAIAKELGIAKDESQSVSGVELDAISDEALVEKVKDLRVFARVSPEHKVRIVKAFKANGNIVSMTGDGVNDAPSLKAADIGVAMGITGTDVAKGAADMVLTDDNFSTIIKAVEEGRNIFANIKKSILFLLSCNIGEIVALFFAILLGWAAPLEPIHILWVNLITDTLPALSLGMDPGDPDVMKNKPRDAKESLFKGSLSFMIFNGVLIGLLTLAAFYIGAVEETGIHGIGALAPGVLKGDGLRHAQTMAFIVLSVSQLVHSLNLRSETKSIFTVGLFTNKYLLGAIAAGIFLQDIVITVPFLAKVFNVNDLIMNDWLIVSALAIVPLIANEIIKIFKRAKAKA